MIYGRLEERRIIVAFLRKYTHLYALAQLLEDGVHLKHPLEIRAYAEKREIGALR